MKKLDLEEKPDKTGYVWYCETFVLFFVMLKFDGSGNALFDVGINDNIEL